MANKTDKLIVNNIKSTLFVIPFYQRGYRWTEKNVRQLLSDLHAFKQSGETEYCLQPIVLQAIARDEYADVIGMEEKVMRVVDGQQRLTTIAIIIDSLGIETSWDIYYDAEKKKLSDILKGSTDSGSINTYFRNKVRIEADRWFKDNGTEQIKSLFSQGIENKQQVVFLEYDIEAIEGEDKEKEGHNAFLRLNDGKTPLTSSELIRALYMVKSSGLTDQQRMEISKEWEIIENCLQNDSFWLMFNARGLEDTPTRIDLLFALVLNVSLRATKANPRIVFDAIEDERNNYDLEKVWNEVLLTFWWMQSCYEDVELCNYLSWIRTFSDISASTIYRNWRYKYTVQNEFKDYVVNTIQETKFAGSLLNSLDSVDYFWDKGELRKLFVLFNIIDCNHSNERFRFDLYNKSKGWDIEHIDSQTPNDFKQEKNKKEWLIDAWQELPKAQRDAFIKEFGFQKETFDISTVDLAEFKSYAEYIVQLTQNIEDPIPEEKTNKLGNLALLNLSINRSYKNDIFPLKRKSIINHVNSGSEFVPPCTVKAFSKFYTKTASRITSWQNADYSDYYDVMNTWFIEFMSKETTHKKDKAEAKAIELKKDGDTHKHLLQALPSMEEPVNKGSRLTGTISFSAFMNTYDVVIPKIQRLYVQGRQDKRGEKCLSGFASSLVESVSAHTPLLLDFVYGIDANWGKSVFYPLDGQQRLTTLLLFFWLCGEAKSDWAFRYESRRTTEVFIKHLLATQPPLLDKPDNYKELKQKAEKLHKNYPSLCRDYIYGQPWFQKSWMCDSGICGMIEMLDSLYDKLLNVSTNENLDMESIVFLINYLDVNVRSYDHIFLKMNSRGKELSEWDNVNAVLNKFLPESFAKSWPDCVQLWYELMWQKVSVSRKEDADKKITIVDNLMLDVVALALDCCDYNKEPTNTYELANWLQEGESTTKIYELCSIFFSALELEEDASLSYLIPNWTISHRPRIPNFACRTSEVIQKFYQPLLVYYASTISTDQEWIRVVWNLVENIDVERQSFKQAFGLIEELSSNKDSILTYLSSVTIDNIKSCYRKAETQLQEEIDKSCQIVNNGESCPPDWNAEICGQWPGWQVLIVTAESKRCLAGAIRFLFHDGSFKVDWNNFFTKWSHVNEYFDDNGIKDEYAASLVSALLKRCTRWEQVHDHFIFDKYDWKYPVLLNTLYAEPLDYILSSQSLNVEVADFENNLVCERIIRDRLFEDKLIKVITANYRDYRLSSGRYFYGWRKHDGILFDWRTNDKKANSWEHRRSIQVKDMQSASSDLIIKNTCVSDEIFFGYSLRIAYKGKNLEWPGNEDVIYVIEHDERKSSIRVSPEMCGESIIQELDELIQ